VVSHIASATLLAAIAAAMCATVAKPADGKSRMGVSPVFSLTVPPGGLERGRNLSAHWFGVPGGRLAAGADVWVMGAYYFPHDMPVVRDWGVVWNFHTVGGDVGWPIGVSPVQIDITNGILHVLTHGAGRVATVDGTPQPVDVAKGDFPTRCRVPLLRDAWTDWVLHVKLDSAHGFVQLWQRGTLIVNAHNVPTLYTGEKYVELMVGFYTNGDSNPGQTFSMKLEPPRLGYSFSQALGKAPAVSGQWGSLDFDPSIVQRFGSRPLSAFIYPRQFSDPHATCHVAPARAGAAVAARSTRRDTTTR
jgi:hypothetical protein